MTLSIPDQGYFGNASCARNLISTFLLLVFLLQKINNFWSFKGILKLILVIFCISWKLAIGSINDIYETCNPVFMNETLQKWHNSLIILSYLAVFPLIEFLPPGQKFISTLLRDILTIYYMGVHSIFGLLLQLNWRDNLRDEFKKYMLIPALISL